MGGTTVLTVIRDHPRMRGEHSNTGPATAFRLGSSPHARGTPRPMMTGIAWSGIIPACAGNTCLCLVWCRGAWDHPRMRGEHRHPTLELAGFRGSSPHARGTLVFAVLLCLIGGIIPACAGNTSWLIFARPVLRYHPRMRGERMQLFGHLLVSKGSSPHARGTLFSHAIWRGICGIIPACAGNTMCVGLTCWGIWDHPRMRGEHGEIELRCLYSWGSSPHARGTPMIRRTSGTAIRIIPACAGNTLCLVVVC